MPADRPTRALSALERWFPVLRKALTSDSPFTDHELRALTGGVSPQAFLLQAETFARTRLGKAHGKRLVAMLYRLASPGPGAQLPNAGLDYHYNRLFNDAAAADDQALVGDAEGPGARDLIGNDDTRDLIGNRDLLGDLEQNIVDQMTRDLEGEGGRDYITDDLDEGADNIADLTDLIGDAADRLADGGGDLDLQDRLAGDDDQNDLLGDDALDEGVDQFLEGRTLTDNDMNDLGPGGPEDDADIVGDIMNELAGGPNFLDRNAGRDFDRGAGAGDDDLDGGRGWPEFVALVGLTLVTAAGVGNLLAAAALGRSPGVSRLDRNVAESGGGTDVRGSGFAPTLGSLIEVRKRAMTRIHPSKKR